MNKATVVAAGAAVIAIIGAAVVARNKFIAKNTVERYNFDGECSATKTNVYEINKLIEYVSKNANPEEIQEFVKSANTIIESLEENGDYFVKLSRHCDSKGHSFAGIDMFTHARKFSGSACIHYTASK